MVGLFKHQFERLRGRFPKHDFALLEGERGENRGFSQEVDVVFFCLKFVKHKTMTHVMSRVSKRALVMECWGGMSQIEQTLERVLGSAEEKTRPETKPSGKKRRRAPRLLAVAPSYSAARAGESLKRAIDEYDKKNRRTL